MIREIPVFSHQQSKVVTITEADRAAHGNRPLVRFLPFNDAGQLVPCEVPITYDGEDFATSVEVVTSGKNGFIYIG